MSRYLDDLLLLNIDDKYFEQMFIQFIQSIYSYI